MAQWFAAKEAHPDALVFFRMGDFYELFFADAEAAAAALDIALTQRGEHNGTPVPMCGVPQHAAEAYLARLIRRGFRVAVAEQMEDPKARTSKAPIRREVVRLITPGTITEEALLEAGRVNLLLALALDGRAGVGAAWLDVSTGLFETMALAQADLASLLGRLEPAEILAAANLPLGEWAGRRAPDVVPSPPLVARRRLAEAFGVASVDAFGSFADAEAIAAVMAVDYVRATQAGTLPRLAHPAPQGATGLLSMDAATRSSLEIHRARDGGTLHTLLGTVQRTLSPAGARMLAGWLSAPLTDTAAIAARQDAWSWLLAEHAAAERLRAAVRSAPDIARALARLSVNRGGPRDLAALRDGLGAARAASATLCAQGAHPLPGVMAGLDPAIPTSTSAATDGRVKPGHDGIRAGHHDGEPAGELPVGLPSALRAASAGLQIDSSLAQRFADALADPAPHRLDDGNAIRAGFDAELDAERALRDDSRRVLATLQLDYAQRYGVASLKIRHHAQLGYVIEAPAAAVERLREFAELTLRQGMANGARFTTPELSDLDRRIAEAGERAAARERAVFAHLVQDATGPCRCARRLCRCAGLPRRRAIRGEAGRVRRMVPPAGDRRGRIPGAVRPSSGRGGGACGPRGLRAQRLRPLAGAARPAAHRSQHGGQVHLPAAERADRRAGAGGAAGSGRERHHRRGGPAVLPRRRGRRSGARPLDLHGGDDRDRRDPASGRAALAGRGGRDRPRHRDAGRSGDRLGGAGGAALGDSLPHHFRHTLP